MDAEGEMDKGSLNDARGRSKMADNGLGEKLHRQQTDHCLKILGVLGPEGTGEKQLQ